jgi:cell division transport system permease protein
MADSYNKRRTQTSSLTTVISLSLVLFMLGFLGLIVLCATRVSSYVKENIGFQIYLKDDAKDVDVRKFQKSLETTHYVKSTEYISKEKALEDYRKSVGEDFMPLLQENVLPASIDMHLKAPYANRDSIEWIRKEIIQEPVVKEFKYVETLVSKINDNIKTISLYLLGIIAVLTIISIALINNTIRLAIYSKRFLIRTMQLVGATHAFISRPFLWKGILHGVYGSVVAIGLLVGATYVLKQHIPDLLQVLDEMLFLGLFGIMLVAGIIISLASTFFAVQKYLRIKTDDLYH